MVERSQLARRRSAAAGSARAIVAAGPTTGRGHGTDGRRPWTATGSNGDGDAGPPSGAGPTAPDTPDDGTPPPGRRDEPPRDEKRRPHAATKDDVVTPSGGAARPGATVYAGDEVSPGDLLGPEDMWWPEGARPSDNPRPPAASGTGPDDTHRPRAETSSPGDAPPPGEDRNTSAPRRRGRRDLHPGQGFRRRANNVRDGGRGSACRAQQCRQRRHARPGGTVRYVYGRRSSPRW